MPKSYRLGPLLFLTLFAFLQGVAQSDWPPVPKDELLMKDYDSIPGQHALILQRTVERDEREGWEEEYVKIKVLDEEGRKYANIETTPGAEIYQVDAFQARTVQPDGTIIPFSGEIFERTIAKYKKYSLYSKALTLPGIKVGSIIEYKVRYHWKPNRAYDFTWFVQKELATRDARFRVRLNGKWIVIWTIFNFPKNINPVETKDEISLEVHDVPAFEREEFMPPEVEAMRRVEFAHRGLAANERVSLVDIDADLRAFMEKTSAARTELATTISANDDPATKLKKLYERVQNFRNLSYEPGDAKKALKENTCVDDVIKRRYGYHNELNRTFVALAILGGFRASLIRVGERDSHFPHREAGLEDFDTEFSLVSLGGRLLFLDPGIPVAQFGTIRWQDTGMEAIELGTKATQWVKLPMPKAEESIERRVADVEIDERGDLNGEVTISWEGQQALQTRLNLMERDDTQRRKDLEAIIKNRLGANVTLELTHIDDWSRAADTFKVKAKVTIPGYATLTGKRMLVPVMVFIGSNEHPFVHARRVHPVYFHVPYTEIDDVTIRVPEGVSIETIPQDSALSTPFSELRFSNKSGPKVFSITRTVTVNKFLFPAAEYPELRRFFDAVKLTGTNQAVLRTSAK